MPSSNINVLTAPYSSPVPETHTGLDWTILFHLLARQFKLALWCKMKRCVCEYMYIHKVSWIPWGYMGQMLHLAQSSFSSGDQEYASRRKHIKSNQSLSHLQISKVKQEGFLSLAVTLTLSAHKVTMGQTQMLDSSISKLEGSLNPSSHQTWQTFPVRTCFCFAAGDVCVGGIPLILFCCKPVFFSSFPSAGTPSLQMRLITHLGSHPLYPQTGFMYWSHLILAEVLWRNLH